MLSLPDLPLRQRDFLLEISRAITARLDLNEVLRRILKASVVMVTGKVGMVALRADDGMFYVRAFAGLDKEQIPAINEKLQELVMGIGGEFDYDDLDRRLREMVAPIDETLQQSVWMPLIIAGEPLGILIVFRSYHAEITNNDLQVLQSFANQAAIAVHNAQLYETVQQERKRLAAILQYSGDGVMILDADLTVLQVNQAFEQMTGWLADAAVGRPEREVMTWEHIERDSLHDAMAEGWPHRSGASHSTETFYTEGDLLRRDGMTVSIGITYSPLFDSNGRINNIIANIRDITNFRRAQEMQSVFISTVSHELRTPVALIKGYASTLTREDAQWDTRTVQQSLHVIEDEADRLTDLIDDLLTASKIQAEQSLSLQKSDVRLDKLGADAVERIQIQSTRHDFSLSFQEKFPAIQADARRIRQVIDNLLTNAIKYSPNGGTITAGGRYTEQNVTFFVRDEGSGIPENEQARIFERFYRVDGTLTSRTQGTGLGLYLVRAIIEAHHGSVHVKSSPGHGSTFYFILPRD
ncbi:MAG: ATP-binding protein [Aggregatilineales bacterium]